MATLRKRIPWLVIPLLILTVSGHAAATFVVPCRGAALCCCRPPVADMDAAGAMRSGMSHESPSASCETKSSQSCGIASNGHAAKVPFIISTSVVRVDGYAPAGLAALATVPAGIVHHSPNDSLSLTGRGDPPLYLVVQTFLI